MMKRALAVPGIVLVLASAAAVLRLAAPRAPAAMPAPSEPPQVVSTVVARNSAWQDEIETVGNVRAVNGANLAFETAGIVSELGFKSGEDVAAGTVIARLRLDDEPGLLAQFKAQADLAAINLNRDTRQFEAQAVSHAIVDTDHATLLADRAQVDAEQARIDEKTLVAPFAGRLGVRQVDLGQYLQPGTAVVTLQALDPIYVDFYVPQQAVPHLAVGGAAFLSVDAWPGRSFAAKLAAITPQVDQASRTVLVRAILDNHDHALVPGMFATVRVVAGASTQLVTLPQTAIAFAPYGDTAFVARKGPHGGLSAHQVLVRTGDERGEQVAVLSGIAPGETVVSSGQLKLHEGTPLIVDNSIQPGSSPHPSLPEE